MGHVYVKRHPDDLNFKGICPFHGDCLEGLISGPTFEARLGKPGKDVPLTDHVFDILAYYIAQAAIQSTLTIRPNKIVFGGGVISEPLLVKVRAQFKQLLHDYVAVGHWISTSPCRRPKTTARRQLATTLGAEGIQPVI